MSSGFINARTAVVAAVVLFCLAQQRVQAATQWAAPQPASASAIPTAQLIQPAELNRLLHTKGTERPLILQVGSRVMFTQAHIPGAEYAGPGSHAEGLSQLRARVASLPRTAFIVLYCGCCPWNRCPNVGPAYSLLNDMGFTRVKVLYLAENFGDDWVNEGFAVEGGH
ncbi:MAG: rhodanese-like domain-containing protein [Terracidiphilus sp.]|jgi:thiosulfate/3-mercaptopyruvate sulfurtransferase